MTAPHMEIDETGTIRRVAQSSRNYARRERLARRCDRAGRRCTQAALLIWVVVGLTWGNETVHLVPAMWPYGLVIVALVVWASTAIRLWRATRALQREVRRVKDAWHG